jgi:hypothetical protein
MANVTMHGAICALWDKDYLVLDGWVKFVARHRDTNDRCVMSLRRVERNGKKKKKKRRWA